MVIDLGCDGIMICVRIVFGFIFGISRKLIFIDMVFVLGCGGIQIRVGFGVGYSKS